MPNYVDMDNPARLASTSEVRIQGIPGNWSDPFDNVERARIEAIEAKYRKVINAPTSDSANVVEMTVAEKAAADTAEQTAIDDDIMAESHDLVHALRKEMRQRLNTSRSRDDEIVAALNAVQAKLDELIAALADAAFTGGAGGRPTAAGSQGLATFGGNITVAAWTAALRTELESI